LGELANFKRITKLKEKIRKMFELDALSCDTWLDDEAQFIDDEAYLEAEYI
jgi:hypothetical protein